MNISEKLVEIRKRIDSAEKRSGRELGSCQLIGVSKTKPLELVLEAAHSGLVHFGENYVQEAVQKIESVKQDKAVSVFWHMIGSLQTNKVKSVVGNFHMIHSVDRLNLARAISKQANELSIKQKILLEVNLVNEPTKSGVIPKDLRPLLEECIALPGLSLEDLMCIPPLEIETENSRRYFKELKHLHEELRPLVPPDRGGFNELSMGTTHDFEVAIEEGATFIRIGTALFGERERK